MTSGIGAGSLMPTATADAPSAGVAQTGADDSADAAQAPAPARGIPADPTSLVQTALAAGTALPTIPIPVSAGAAGQPQSRAPASGQAAAAPADVPTLPSSVAGTAGRA